MTLEQIVNALQVLRVACGTSSATYANGHFTTYEKHEEILLDKDAK